MELHGEVVRRALPGDGEDVRAGAAAAIGGLPHALWLN